jgi:ubiquitin carboxyl-terminal hydrolase 7
MIEPLKAKQTLKAAELQDGDIVCFQKAPSDSATDNSTDASTEANQKYLRFPTSEKSLADVGDRSLSSRSTIGSTLEDVRSFYDFLIHKKTVTFLPWVKQPDNPGFRLELSSKTTYEQLAARVGEKLDIRPTHLKFYTVLNNGNPKNPVKRINTQVLHNILQPSTFANTNQKTDSLMYEVLDMSLAELETKKLLKVTWWSDDITKEVSSVSALATRRL